MNFEPLNPEDLVIRLAAIVDSSDDAIIGTDAQGVINTWNSAARALFGYTDEEAIGQPLLLLTPPDLHTEERNIQERAKQGEKINHYETQRLRKGGTRLDVSLSVSPVHDKAGKIVGSALIVREIGARLRGDAARTRLAAIVESSDDAIIAKDLNGVITDWNAAAERLFGYRREEIIGRSILTLIPSELQHEEPAIIERLRNGERIEHYETRRLRKNGESFDVSLTVSPLRDEKGRVVGGSKILRDISERKASEALLIEKEKLAATGRLAATLAHEVNNPLESITNLAYLLAEHSSLDPEAHRYAQMLLAEAQRAGEITRQTLAYYRVSKTPADVDLQQVIDHVIKAKRRKIEAKNLQLEVNLQDIPPVKGFQGELHQVFDNLIENAIDAAPVSGHLQIHAGTREERRGGFVRVSVCDDGPGIPAANLAKIFEPFFTTKAEKGSGLGLWVSLAIAKKHGGIIHVRSSKDPQHPGTTFILELPLQGVAQVHDPAVAMHSARL